jgi:hypothetical protein
MKLKWMQNLNLVMYSLREGSWFEMPNIYWEDLFYYIAKLSHLLLNHDDAKS